MMHWKRNICLLALVALLVAACSDKGVRMPRHRKKAHCDCPTFAVREEKVGAFEG